jgi:HEAT repeat protein
VEPVLNDAWRANRDSAGKRQACLELADAAGALPGPAEVALLVRLLLDPDAEVQETAAFSLKTVVSGRPELTLPLLNLAADLSPEDHPVHAVISDAVALAGSSALQYVLLALTESSVEVRRVAATALAALAPTVPNASWPELYAALGDPDGAVRLAATRAVGLLGPAAKGAGQVLVPLLEDGDSELRVAAAESLVRLGDAEPAVPVLLDALADRSSPFRPVAAAALGSASREARESLPALRQLLADPDSSLRAAALRSLVNIDLSDADAGHAGSSGGLGVNLMEWVCGALGDPSYEMRAEAARALAAIGPPTSLAARDQLFNVVVEVLDGDQFFISVPAVLALASMGPAVVPLLADALERHRDVRYRAAAATTLGEIGSGAASALPALSRALGDPDWLVQVRAAAALVAVGRVEEGFAHLGAAARAADWRMRCQAAFILGRLPGSEAFAVSLLREAIGDSHPIVRRQAAESLGRWGPAATQATSALRGLLGDADELVRRQALRSLEDIRFYRERQRLTLVRFNWSGAMQN